ncbi:aminoacyl-tRNA deacylase and HDOD domain-containing protein [Litoribacillus peritrichatus]|uniref:HDOD domain-containing protein n=1 Tax=Litoribacillus peritrichatus TaxID=718191 RepID=A0ABP7NCB5_9GAMM
MSIAASLKLLLTKNQIEYVIEEKLQNLDGFSQKRSTLSHCTRSTVLMDQVGKVQVITPYNSFLDLTLLNNVIGRQLSPAKPDTVARMCETINVETLPAVPALTRLDVIIDKNLLELPFIYIESGKDGHWIKMDTKDFLKLCPKARPENISTPIDIRHIGEMNTTTEEDRETISQAVIAFNPTRMKQRLEETMEIPPLPTSAQQIIRLRSDPSADIDKLTNIIETDPSLAAQIVSWASSPIYNPPGTVRSVHDACMRVLGFDMVLNLSLGLALGRTLPLPKEGPNGYTPFWYESVFVAASIGGLVAAISREKRPSFGLSYLTGLLHEIGYLVLAYVFPPHFDRLCRHLEVNKHLPDVAIDNQVMKVNRYQVGSWLMNYWQMPTEICVGLKHQLNPDYDGKFHAYANLIYLAKAELKKRGIGNATTSYVPESLYDRLGLDPETVTEIIDKVIESSSDLKNMAQALMR